jgi:hypothetical protein
MALNMEFNQTKLFLIKNEKVNLSEDDRPIVKRLKPSSDEAQYDKFYSLYAFDEIGYHRELKKIIEERNLKGVYCLPLAERKEIRKKHYVLDIYGERMSKSDENHIFRIAVLHKIYNNIYSQFLFKYALYEDVTNIDGLLFYQEELQCEIDGFQMKSLKVRVLAHLELLRLLKKGYDIKESVKRVRKEFLNGN